MMRERDGLLLAVSDEDMLEAQRELASSEGLFCQPESATTLAALKRLRDAGRLRTGEGSVVLILTGSGLKTLHLLASAPLEIHQFAIDGLEAGLARLSERA
jgi:threonine synthase